MANASHTNTLTNLDAARTAANNAAALDDPIAIAAASRDAADAVAGAWQQVNAINARAAETFFGEGPGSGSWAVSVAAFGTWIGEWSDIIGAGFGGAGQGLAAWADGFIPFYDPFDSFYDTNDPTLQWSVFFGGVSRDALLLAAGGGNLSAWVRHPFLYELGATTTKLFPQISHLSVVARGEWIWARYGMSGFFLGAKAPMVFRFTIPQGLTPGATFALHAVDALWENYDEVLLEALGL